MRVSYEAVVIPNESGTYDVTCPDLAPGSTFTACGIADAASLGARAVATAVHRCIEAGAPLPTPAPVRRPESGGFVLGIAFDVEMLRGSVPGCCTVAEAAAILNVSTSRVRALARSGRLKSSKYGNLWFISVDSLNDRVAHPCRPGRPPKNRPASDLPAA